MCLSAHATHKSELARAKLEDLIPLSSCLAVQLSPSVTGMTDDGGFDSAWLTAKNRAVRVRKRCRRDESDFATEAQPSVAAKAKASPAPQARPDSSLGEVALTVSGALKAVCAVTTRQAVARTTYETDGADPDRVRARLKHATCSCSTHQCFRDISPKALVQVCVMFWSLSAGERALLLREAYHTASGHTDKDDCEDGADGENADVDKCKRSKKVTWSLCGKPVCFRMFCHLLGTGTNSVRKSIAGEPDMRRSDAFGERQDGETLNMGTGNQTRKCNSKELLNSHQAGSSIARKPAEQGCGHFLPSLISIGS